MLINPFLKTYNYFRKTEIIKKYSGNIFENINEIIGYQDFVVSWGKTVRNSLIKDIEFARWRYSAPGRRYKFLTISYDNKLVGFLSFRKIVKEGVLSYGILDYMVLPGHEDCNGLINKILKNEAQKDDVECLLCMMRRILQIYYCLLKNGFL